MLRSAVWTLRQPRYAALAAFMFVLALACVGLGTWQIARFKESVHANDALKGNAHAASTPLTPSLVPLVGGGAPAGARGPAPTRDDILYRTVSVSGTYVAGGQQFVAGQDHGERSGYYALNPLRTADGVLLVVRGFVAATSAGGVPSSVAGAPSGTVRISGRLQLASTKHDNAGELGRDQVTAINPAEQATRLATPVFDTYLELGARQPGSAGVDVLPKPDLSNPAGGAYEGQHFAYIIQWYLFALLALAAPFLIGRKEVREARKQFLGIDASQEQFDEQFAARTSRPALDTAPAEGAVAVRPTAALARADAAAEARYQRAAQLADRYGLSLGRDESTRAPSRFRRAAAPRVVSRSEIVRNSADRPHRSEDDEFHGSYNDYLWQLALADGDIPPAERPEPPTGPDAT